MEERKREEERNHFSGEDHYRHILRQMLADEEDLHKQNLNKIKIGIRCLFWIPLIFLTLIFLTSGSKVIFLVLWIASLFGIAAYLIYIEYTDFNQQEKLRQYKQEDGENANLIGGEMESLEEAVDEMLELLEEKKADSREKVLAVLRRHKDELKDSDQKGDSGE